MSSNLFTPENISSQWNTIMSYAGNISISAFLTTIAVAAIKLPSDKILQLLSKNQAPINQNDLKLAALYAGGTTFIKFGLLRSCYCVHSKQMASHSSCPSEKSATEERYLEKTAKKVLDISLLAFGETALTHIPDHKTTLAQQKISYHHNLQNLMSMLRAGLGLRYTSAVFNLVCLTHIQDLYLKTLFNDKQSSPTDHAITGALSGVTAAVISYPLKQLQTQISVGVQEKERQLTYPKTFELMKHNFHDIKKTPIKNTFQSISPILLIRCFQNTLLFATITGINSILGPSPMTEVIELVHTPFKKP